MDDLTMPPSTAGPTTQHDVGVVAVRAPASALAMVVARKGRLKALIKAAKTRFGAELPLFPSCWTERGLSVAALAPGRWLLMGAGASADFAPGLAAAFSGLASVVDQSGAYVVSRLHGERVEHALTRLVQVDLHPDAFPVGAVAATDLEHVPVVLIRRPDGFDLFAPRSYAIDVEASLAEAAQPWGFAGVEA